MNSINQQITYLNSKKFHNGDELDGYINVSEVIDMLEQIKDDLNELDK